MTPLESAQQSLQSQMTRLGAGSARPPAEGTRDWYLLRAFSVGLSALRTLEAEGLSSDHAGFERAYKQLLRENKEEILQVSASANGAK